MRQLKGWPARVGATALVVAALDWGTQFWVSHALVLGHRLWSGGPVQIHYITDGGGSILPVAPWLVPLLVVAALVATTIHFRHLLASSSWWVQMAAGVAAGGWLGNTLEAFVVGHIVDYLQLGVGNKFWIINPADVAILVGGAVAGGSLLPGLLRQWLLHAKGWAERASAVAAAGVVATIIAAAATLWASPVGVRGMYSTPVIAASTARYTWSQVQQAWSNGAYAGSEGSWLVTPSQCAILAKALEWKGPLPTSLTTTVAIDGPRQAVPTCELQARQSAVQDVAAMRQPLNDQLNQNAISYFLYLNLGSNATAVVQAESQTACLALRGACTPTANYGHFMAYYSVQLVFPARAYSLWQKVIFGAS